VAYTIRIIEYFDQFPGGVVVLGNFSLLAAILFYVILFGLTLAWSRIKGVMTPAVIFSLLSVFAVLTWSSVLNAPDGRLHVIFLNAGSADSILVRTPSGRFILINGGESPSLLADQLGRRIPPLSRGIDYLLIASTQENQVAALPRVLEQYHPKSVLWTGNPEASFSSGRLNEWLKSNHIPIEKAKADTAYDLGDGAILRFLAVSPRGAVISIEMGNFKIVLPVGVNFDVFEQLKNGAGLGPVTALLLSESGYAPANPPEWLANLNPQVAVLSVAASDPTGLPSADLLATFEKSTLLRTDIYGWIDLSSDGRRLQITSEHQKE
jgi:competence protein ComEC